MARAGNDPTRRIARPNTLAPADLTALAGQLIYVGSAIHKTKPADYGFEPPVNPRPFKSICDGLRIIRLAEARALFRAGILRGMFSSFFVDGVPKYIWSVDGEGQAFEAKIGNGGYHGYRLEDEDNMRRLVIREWGKR